MTDQEQGSSPRPIPLVTGLGLVLASAVAAGTTVAGVSVPIGGFDVISLGAGVLALALLVGGLRSATRGAYRQGVGALSGGAGLVLIFLAPQARSEPLFVGTGALLVALSGLFLIAEGFGYVLVAVDDTDAEESASIEEREETPADLES